MAIAPGLAEGAFHASCFVHNQLSRRKAVTENNRPPPELDHDLEVRRSTYEWSVRLFRVLQKVLKVNVKLHHSEDQIEEGEIFLFNHFARFETFIPQYLIYRETGAMCRSVASAEFFAKEDAFTTYLLNAGAVPNNLPNLLPFLAREALRGRKIIVFPEGGMVKDRRVLDMRGGYSVYSRKANERRKHHTGAAVLGLALDVFKQAVLHAHEQGHMRRLQSWAKTLKLDGVDQLLSAARRPTAIVPANITFYPIRVSDNLLRKGAELLNKGLSRRMSEELMIEGNILLKHTDMDVRLGDPIRPQDYWRWLDSKLLSRFTSRLQDMEEAFELRPANVGWDRRLLARRMRLNVLRVRDEYMHRMYCDVTVNLSHLASSVVLTLIDRDRFELPRSELHQILYLTVKKIQRAKWVHLHRSLRNPETYSSLLTDECQVLSQFLTTTSTMELLEIVGEHYRLLPKLEEEHGFDDIRLENLVEVYANEAAPLPDVREAIAGALDEAPTLARSKLARLQFDDEKIALAWDRVKYSKERHQAINQQQTATADPQPFLLEPNDANGLGIVLVHGFLASPAEVRGFGDKLAERGYRVIGIRLKGHGTSPWDLRDRSWEDWLDSVARGYRIMASLSEGVALVGFSTGGALALRLAADKPEGLQGVAAVAVPQKFKNKNMVFVPLMHRANRLIRWASSFEGIMPFRASENTEHPHINYRHMPIRGLYELRRIVEALKDKLPEVSCPVRLLQGDEDPVVVPGSAEIIHDRLGTEDKDLEIIPSKHHGILYQDVGVTQQRIVEFLGGLAR